MHKPAGSSPVKQTVDSSIAPKVHLHVGATTRAGNRHGDDLPKAGDALPHTGDELPQAGAGPSLMKCPAGEGAFAGFQPRAVSGCEQQLLYHMFNHHAYAQDFHSALEEACMQAAAAQPV